MAQLAAVVGVGQTKYKTKRADVSIAGLVREAAQNALNDAGLGWDDIDAVILGKAPDMFEGVIMPELSEVGFFAMPKSNSLARPVLSNMTLAGLRSRCTMLFRCASARTSRT